MSLAKAVQLIEEHKGNLGEFLVHDPKGRQLPAFLVAVSGQLTREHALFVIEFPTHGNAAQPPPLRGSRAPVQLHAA